MKGEAQDERTIEGKEGRPGETYAQAIEATGYDVQTLMNAKSIASKVENYRRRENVSWAHHAEVAVFEPEEQVRWLDEAEKQAIQILERRTKMKLRHGNHFHDVVLDGDEIIEQDGKSVVSGACVVRTRAGELICSTQCESAQWETNEITPSWERRGEHERNF